MTAVLWSLFILAVLLSVILTPPFVSRSRTVEPTSKIRLVTREDFTVADHYARVCEFVDKRYMASNKYDDYQVYPLFDENDEFTYYFVVDFAPAGFVFVGVMEGDYLANGMLGIRKYKPCITTTNWAQWRYSTSDAPAYDLNWQQNAKNNNYYVVDESGEVVLHKDSPFKVANMEGEMRYMLQCKDSNSFVLAVKRGEQFFNVISQETFTYDENFKEETHVSFFVAMD